MIKLFPTTALIIYFSFTLGFVLWLWVRDHWQRRKKKLINLDKRLSTCEYCHFAYLIEMGRTISQCPQCQSFNKDKLA